MAEKKVSQPEEGVQLPPQPEVDPNKYVSVDDFRKMQGVKDKEVARLQKQLDDFAQQMQRERDEFLALMQDNPQVKASAELAQDRAKAQLYDQMQRQRQLLDESRNQWASFYGLDMDELMEAQTPQDVARLAVKLHDDQLLAKVKPKDEKEDEEEEEPLSTPAAQGPAPDSTLEHDSERMKAREGWKEAARDPDKPKREHVKARLELLKVSKPGSGASRRPRV